MRFAFSREELWSAKRSSISCRKSYLRQPNSGRRKIGHFIYQIRVFFLPSAWLKTGWTRVQIASNIMHILLFLLNLMTKLKHQLRWMKFPCTCDARRHAKKYGSFSVVTEWPQSWIRYINIGRSPESQRHQKLQNTPLWNDVLEIAMISRKKAAKAAVILILN